MTRCINLTPFILLTLIISLLACGSRSHLTYYHDPDMDFAAIRTVAVLPFEKKKSAKGSDTVVKATRAKNSHSMPPLEDIDL